MLDHSHSDWRYGFWSALALEMLGRAALSNISPALVANGQSWENIYFALGYQPNVSKFQPKTEDTSKVFIKIKNIFPDFNDEMLSFVSAHLDRRNSELHSGALAFDEHKTSMWLPLFYETCQCLLHSMNLSLEDFLGRTQSEIAIKLIEARKDDAAKSVRELIQAYKKVWSEKEESERDTLSAQAEIIASKHYGHRVHCPSCDSTASLQGSPAGAVTKNIQENIIIERQTMLPSSFECVACGLRIGGYSKLISCGLGDAYTSTSYYDAAEYFGIEAHDEWAGYEDDNNDP